MGIIGAGGRGGANTNGVKGETIHTLCDVDPSALAGAKAKFPDAKTTSDWREVVANPDIDAVVISTADHHHALASLAAMRAGKHVYCEKPLAHTVQEARWMQEEYGKQKGRIATQMGTQIHATGNYRKAVSAVRDGAAGKVTQVHVWCGRTIKPVAKAKLAEQEVPEGFNWDVWLGPAADRSYNQGYWKGGNLNWNRRWEFGNGVLGDMGSHLIDLAYWAMELDYPISVKAEGTSADRIAAPPSQIVTWKHPNGLEVIWYHGPEGMKTMAERLQPMLGDKTNISNWNIGVGFVGSEGVLVSDYGKIVRSSDTKYVKKTEIEPSVGHYAEWLQACRGEGESLCNFDYSGKLIEHNLLGNVAHRAALGQELEWDANAFHFKDHVGANGLLTKTYRAGWAPKA
jgi:predicted dehydrogenase